MDSKIRQIAEQLGVDSGQITRSETLSERHGHRIWRLHTPERPYILKWLPNDTSAVVEVAAYRAVQRKRRVEEAAGRINCPGGT